MILLSLLSLLTIQDTTGEAPKRAASLYEAHCATCHGAGRLGGMGPALLPSNLERLKRPEAVRVIREGRAATQMPGFAGKLTDGELERLADWIYTAPTTEPVWDAHEIRASRIVYADERTLSPKPIHVANPENLFVVVEAGDHHVTVLDGDRFTPVTRFRSRFALHGGPKFTPDGRYVFFASRDGWISKYDLYNLVLVVEIRAGLNTRNLAISDDGSYVLVGNYLPHSLVLLRAADLTLVRVIPVRTTDDKSSRVSAVYQAAPRRSFVVALKDAREFWEISYATQAPKSWVHDYNTESGDMTVVTMPFPIRRVQTTGIWDDFMFDPTYRYALASSRNGNGVHVIDLDLGTEVATLPISGMPHLASGIAWRDAGQTVLATPNLKDGTVTVIDTRNWRVRARVNTLGPGFFLRSHENHPYAWLDNALSEAKDTLQLIDKKTLRVAHTLRPAPGRSTYHVEFTQDGRYALVSVSELDGELLVYDTKTLRIVKRLRMRKPVGKYNVANKIHRSDGTSH